MSIAYTYEIVKVDEAARCMEIVYTADGHETMRVGARLPYDGETLEQIIEMFSPVAYWEEKQRPVVLPTVGATGSITPVQIVEPEPSPEPEPDISVVITDANEVSL
jgi:hypothetical protein